MQTILATERLLQPCVLDFRLLQNRDVRVGVFPEAKEIVVCGFRLGGVTCHGVCKTAC